MSAKLVQIVLTPGSGDGRARATARRLQKALGRRGYEVRIQTFTNLEGLLEWSDTCAPDFGHLVAIGGDATISAAAAASVRLSIPFVPVPNGFGNMFALAFGFGNQTHRVIDLFERGVVRRVDVGQFSDGRLFLSHRSFGLLNDIQEAVERGRAQPKAHLWRHLAYYAEARKFLFSAPLSFIRVEVDGAVLAEEAALVTVANVETYRGYLSLTPTASPIDGLFDVFTISSRSRLGLWMRVLRLLVGSRRGADGVAFGRGQRVRVTVDGHPPEELVVNRRALPLLVRPESLAELRARQVEAEEQLAQP
ncbi:MAG TPA: diacylglycerol kinase family protein [Methylomirabilota bacterium]